MSQPPNRSIKVFHSWHMATKIASRQTIHGSTQSQFWYLARSASSSVSAISRTRRDCKSFQCSLDFSFLSCFTSGQFFIWEPMVCTMQHPSGTGKCKRNTSPRFSETLSSYSFTITQFPALFIRFAPSLPSRACS